MRISVVVLTYNWPCALKLVLEALARQTQLPYEVIVADDGSRADTRELLESLAPRFPTRLVHVWQEDDGARMSRARNRGIAAAGGDYIVLLDGDMVVDAHFIADHQRYAQEGCFAQGSRVLVDPANTERMLAGELSEIRFFTPGIERRRHTLRMPFLSGLYAQPKRSAAGIKSCNMAFWRSDLLRLNGFNEAMTGWGREDAELAARAFNAGLLRRDIRFSALAFHLHHTSRKNLVDNPNDAILDASRAHKLVRCELGIDAHLGEFSTPPPALNAAPQSS